MSAEAADPRKEPDEAKPTVAGYVDAVKDGRVYGWAFDRLRPEARIAIRVMNEGALVLALVADKARPDLAAGSVGDGRHAFEAELPSGCSELVSVLAVCPETGVEVLLQARAPAGADAPPAGTSSEELRTTIMAVAHTQRVLHRNVQALAQSVEALRGRPQEDPGSGTADAADDLDARIRALESSVVRIDGIIAPLDEAAKAQPLRGSDPVARLIAVTAALMGAAALAVALLD